MGERPKPGSVLVYLKSGKVIDITGLGPEEGVAKLKQQGVTTDDIEQTAHWLAERMTERVK